MKRQFKKTIHPNIQELRGATYTTYIVRTNRTDLKLNKTFTNYTDALNYLNEALASLQHKYNNEIKKELNILCYPENIINDLGFNYVDVIDEFEKNLTDILSARELEFILAYYKDEKTLNQIAQEYNLSHTRPAQIIASALRKCKYHEKLFVFGEYSNAKKFIENKYKEYLEGLKQYWTYESAKEFIRNYEVNNPEKFPVDLTEFSVRVQNCLHRNGIHSIPELLNYSELDLFKFKNMGRKSLKEIMTLLKKYNLKLREDTI